MMDDNGRSDDEIAGEAWENYKKRKKRFLFDIQKFLVFCFENCSDLQWEKNVLLSSMDLEKLLQIRCWRLRTRTIYSNSEIFETEFFFNLLLEVPVRSDTIGTIEIIIVTIEMTIGTSTIFRFFS